jgi:fumarate reductase subunit C
MLRELSGLFVLLYCALLAIGLARLAQGEAAWDRFLAAATGGAGMLVQVTCGAFAILHAVTWFAETPKALPIPAGARRATISRAVIALQYFAWAAISLVIIRVAGG